MPLHSLTPTQLQLVYAMYKNAPEGEGLLPRQIIGGRELECLLRLSTIDVNMRIYLYENEAGEMQGAFIIRQQYAGSEEVQVCWIVLKNVTRTTLRRIMFEGLDLVFSEPDVQRVTWDLVQSRYLQADLYRKLGFSVEGKFREAFRDGESRLDIVRLGLLRGAWFTTRKEIDPLLVHADLHKDEGLQRVIQVLMDPCSWITPYVDELAQEWELAGHTVRIAHSEEQSLPADFCFCLSFSRIISEEVRRNYRHTLVVHESDLPDGRGWAPMSWQILEGKGRIPVTLIEAVDAVDAGPIYLQEWITLNGTELSPEWRILQAQATQSLCREWVRSYPGILKKARQQQGAGSVYARRRPADSRLDPAKTLAEQFALLRIVDNEKYPAFFEMNNRRYIVRIDPHD